MSLLGLYNQNAKAQESVTGGWKTIEVDHSNIHENNGYSLVPSTAGVLALNNAQTHWILIEQTSADTDVVHWKENLFVTDGFDIKVRLLEDITVPTTGNGTAIATRNRNRRSSDTSQLTIYWTSSSRVADEIWKVGTVVLETFWLNGSSSYFGVGNIPVGSHGANTNLSIEWMFKSTTNYALEISNIETSCWIAPWFYWYEESS
jgi:hypothetical protein